MKRYYVGLAASSHDPALAIIDDRGEVLFAEGTERYLQYKRAMDCPPDNRPLLKKVIKAYCDPSGEFILARSWSDHLHKILGRMKLIGLFNSKKLMGRKGDMTKYLVPMFEVFLGANALYNQLNLSGMGFAQVLRADFNNTKLRFVDCIHHEAHAAMSCYSSVYDDAACMIVDGMGELGSISYYEYKAGRLKELKRHKGPESLGVLYSLVTTYCGFDPIAGEEWKVMGLAPYGKLIDEVYGVLMDLLSINDLMLKYTSRKHLDRALAVLEKYRRPADAPPVQAADLAFTVQQVYEDTMNKLLNNFYKLGISDNLCIGGGCGLNSAYNGKIVETTPFKQVHIPCAPADDGNALGAAWVAYFKDNPNAVHKPKLLSPFLGHKVSQQTLEYFNSFSQYPKVRHLPGKVAEETAKLMAEGKLIGWFQGRSEFGPRALGNRSILADPRPADMKDKINALVKFREEFRPFAPAILHEHGPEWFEVYQETPYMERTLRFREEVRDRVPAVVHANTTGRLQSVRREQNERYYDLISAFHKLTGVPIILNTSFNIMGKPIIHSLEDALGVFFTTGLEVLVIDDYIIEK